MNFGVCDFSRFALAALALVVFGAYDSYHGTGICKNMTTRQRSVPVSAGVVKPRGKCSWWPGGSRPGPGGRETTSGTYTLPSWGAVAPVRRTRRPCQEARGRWRRRAGWRAGRGPASRGPASRGLAGRGPASRGPSGPRALVAGLVSGSSPRGGATRGGGRRRWLTAQTRTEAGSSRPLGRPGELGALFWNRTRLRGSRTTWEENWTR